jgi:ribosomal-protein-alanine N-acetyltransferase
MERQLPIDEMPETGAPPKFEVGPVSMFLTPRAVEIDSSWNPRPWSERLFLQELRNPAARVRGVYVDDDLIGYLIAHIVMNEAHIVTFGIAPEWQRRGAGRALLNDFLRYAAFQGVGTITLEVRRSNVGAQALYRSVGFEVMGVRPHYYSSNGEDALNMKLLLPN